MTKSTLNLLALSAFIGLWITSCDSKSSTTNTQLDASAQSSSTDADSSESSIDPMATKAKNHLASRFGYEITLPENCHYTETSDGYDIQLVSGTDDSISVKLYSETLQPELDDILAPECESDSAFAFSDSLKGKQCINESSSTFFIELQNLRHCFTIPNWTQLSMLDQANVITLIKSIKFAIKKEETKPAV